MSTAELFTHSPVPAPPLKLYSPTLTCPHCWEGQPAKVRDRFARPLGGVGIRMPGRVRCHISEQWWKRVNVLVPRHDNRQHLWQPPHVRKQRRRKTWHGVRQPYVQSPNPCLTCQRPFQSVEELYDHLLTACWDYDDVGAVPRTTDDLFAELYVCRLWTKVIHHGDNHARNVLLASLVPLFRSKKICGQDRTGDRMSIALYAAAVEIEKARNDPNHPLRNGDTFFPDPRQRLTSHSLRELKEAAKAEPDEPISDSAIPVKTTFEWLANAAKTAIHHAENGWKEIIDGKVCWHGGDRNHGVTAVPTKKKAGKAKSKYKRRPEVMRADEEEYTRANRTLTKDDAGVDFREFGEWQRINAQWREVTMQTKEIEIDSCVKFDHEHNRFSQTWDDLTILIAVAHGILKRDEDGFVSLDVEGWINDHIPDPTDREILMLRAEGLSQEKIAKQVRLTRPKIRTRLDDAKEFCCRELKEPLESESVEKPKYQPAPVVTIQEVAKRIESRKEGSKQSGFVRSRQ